MLIILPFVDLVKRHDYAKCLIMAVLFVLSIRGLYIVCRNRHE